jgi:hypothetical protein
MVLWPNPHQDVREKAAPAADVQDDVIRAYGRSESLQELGECDYLRIALSSAEFLHSFRLPEPLKKSLELGIIRCIHFCLCQNRDATTPASGLAGNQIKLNGLLQKSSLCLLKYQARR